MVFLVRKEFCTTEMCLLQFILCVLNNVSVKLKVMLIELYPRNNRKHFTLQK